jgi:hypothetical protein
MLGTISRSYNVGNAYRCHMMAGSAGVRELRQAKDPTAGDVAFNFQNDCIGSGAGIDQEAKNTNFHRVNPFRFPRGDLGSADQRPVCQPAYAAASFTAEQRSHARASRHRRLRLEPLQRCFTHDPGADHVLSAEHLSLTSGSESPTHRRNHLS